MRFETHFNQASRRNLATGGNGDEEGDDGTAFGGGIYVEDTGALTTKTSLVVGNFASTSGNNIFME